MFHRPKPKPTLRKASVGTAIATTSTATVIQALLRSREDRTSACGRALAFRMARLLDLDLDRNLLWLFARAVEASPY